LRKPGINIFFRRSER